LPNFALLFPSFVNFEIIFRQCLLPFAFLVLAGMQGCGSGQSSTGSSEIVRRDTVAQGSGTPTEPAAVTVLPAGVVANPRWHRLGLYLAGDAPLDTTDSLLGTSAYRAFHTEMQARWQRKDTLLLAKLRTFARTEFPTYHAWTGTAFYPFGGPDFLSIYQLYPQASRYVLCGLEDEGNPDQMLRFPAATWEAYLANQRTTLRSILDASFFITAAMQRDLRRTPVRGLLPTLLTFLSHTGCEPLTVRRFVLDASGTPAYLTDTATAPAFGAYDTLVSGIEIQFKAAGESRIRTLQYLAFDASNAGYPKRKELDAFFAGLGTTVTFFKSASYLMHGQGFSVFRTRIENQSRFVMQDETGFPYEFYQRPENRDRWKLRFFGRYGRPIPDFTWAYQKQLQQVYTTDTTVKPVNFQIGYGRICTVILAEKQPAP
jgi:hypothetical protein